MGENWDLWFGSEVDEETVIGPFIEPNPNPTHPKMSKPTELMQAMGLLDPSQLTPPHSQLLSAEIELLVFCCMQVVEYLNTLLMLLTALNLYSVNGLKAFRKVIV